MFHSLTLYFNSSISVCLTPYPSVCLSFPTFPSICIYILLFHLHLFLPGTALFRISISVQPHTSLLLPLSYSASLSILSFSPSSLLFMLSIPLSCFVDVFFFQTAHCHSSSFCSSLVLLISLPTFLSRIYVGPTPCYSLPLVALSCCLSLIWKSLPYQNLRRKDSLTT